MNTTFSPYQNGVNIGLVGDAEGSCTPQLMPVLPRKAARLSLSVDFPGYCELLQAPVRRNASEAYSARSLHQALTIRSNMTSEDERCYPMRSLPPNPPALPPGFSLGSVCGPPVHLSGSPGTSQGCRSHRSSVDGAAAAEILNSCTAAEASVWQLLSDQAAACKITTPELHSSASAPAKLSELRFESNFILARVQARYAAMDALQELRYETPSERSSSKGSRNGRRRHRSSWSSGISGSSSHRSASYRKSSTEIGDPGGMVKDKETYKVGRHAGLYGSSSGNSSPGSSSGGGGAHAASQHKGWGRKFGWPWGLISLLASSTCKRDRGSGRGKAAWRHCRQLVWSRKANQPAESGSYHHDCGSPDGDGEGDCCGGESEARLQSMDSRLIHRARLGLDVRSQNVPPAAPLFSRHKKDSDGDGGPGEPGRSPKASASGRSATGAMPMSPVAVISGRPASITLAASAVRRAWLRCKSMGAITRLRSGTDGVAPDEAFTPICPAASAAVPSAATSPADERCTAPANTYRAPSPSSSLWSVRPLGRQLTEPVLHRALAAGDLCTPSAPGRPGSTALSYSKSLRARRISSIWPTT